MLPDDLERNVSCGRCSIAFVTVRHLGDGCRRRPAQIIRKLDEGHRQLAAGKELDEVRRHLEIAEST